MQSCRLLPIVLLAAVVLSQTHSVQASELTVIELDETTVTRDALSRRFDVAIRLLVHQQGLSLSDQNPAVIERLRKQYLDKRAMELVLLQEAKRRKLEVAEETIDEVLAGTFDSDVERAQFAQDLRQDGVEVDQQLRQIIEDEQTLQLLREQMLGEIVIPPSDVITLHHDARDRMGTPEQYCVRHIQVADQETAERMIAMLGEGAEFAKLAIAHSEDAESAQSGGDLECFEKGHHYNRSAFQQAVFAAKENEIVGPVKSEFGYHVIELYDHRPSREPTLNEAYAGIERELQLEELPQKIKELVEQSELKKYPENF